MDYSIVKAGGYTVLMLWLLVVPFILTSTLAIVSDAWPAALMAAVAAVSLAKAV